MTCPAMPTWAVMPVDRPTVANAEVGLEQHYVQGERGQRQQGQGRRGDRGDAEQSDGQRLALDTGG